MLRQPYGDRDYSPIATRLADLMNAWAEDRDRDISIPAFLRDSDSDRDISWDSDSDRDISWDSVDISIPAFLRDSDSNPQPQQEEPGMSSIYVYLGNVVDPMDIRRRRQRRSRRAEQAFAGNAALGNRSFTLAESNPNPAEWRTLSASGLMLRWMRSTMRDRGVTEISATFEALDEEGRFHFPVHNELLRLNEDRSITTFERPPLRRCSRCGAEGWERTENFAPRPNGGFDSWCRECHREYSRIRRNMARFGRRFGVEIECNLVDSDYGDPLPSHVVADALRDAGIGCYDEGYTHHVYEDGWKIVSDSSIMGWEIVSPPLYWHQRDQIETVCRVIRELGGTAGSDCGLHVHHEVSDLSLTQFKRMVTNWANVQYNTDTLTSASRRNGQWSARLGHRELSTIEAANSLEMIRDACSYCARYRSMNLTAFPSYGTVEIRQHQGTVNARKIIAWIAYTQAVINASMNGDELGDGLSTAELVEQLPMPDPESFDVRAYLTRRAEVLSRSMHASREPVAAVGVSERVFLDDSPVFDDTDNEFLEDEI